MMFENENKSSLILPQGLIVLISGTPGVGKTTASYQLLKQFKDFRIVQETDLIREILRGYNEYIGNHSCNVPCNKQNQCPIYIPTHEKIFTYLELKQQCQIMKNSIENIILRQQRKQISTIINGVHIVPEILNGICQNKNIRYINLYLTSIDVLKERLSTRDPKKYMPYLNTIYSTNRDLFYNVEKLMNESPQLFLNLDVTYRSVEETIREIINFLQTI